MKQLLRFSLLFLLLHFAFHQAALIRDLSPTVSLRFDTAVSSEQPLPFDAVWAEERTIVSGIACTLIRFDGDALLAFPATYPYGSPPNSLMKKSCAVSSQLAWQLCGGTDMTGLTLELFSEEYTICGVFAHEEPALLVPDGSAFTAAELRAPPSQTDLYRYAKACAAQSGLAEPAQVLCGPESAIVAGLLPWLCVMVSAWPLLRRMACRRAVLWVPGVVLTLWHVIPAWWIPTRWSDRVFWSELTQSLLSRLRDWMAFPPALRDLSVKLAWLQLWPAMMLALLLSTQLCSISRETFPCKQSYLSLSPHPPDRP